jgi:nucleoside-diphosphate-sugar epimerase
MARFTVIGGSGFIGSALVQRLEEEGHDCRVPARGENLHGAALGHLVYCAGLTGDWRERPYAAVEAHVTVLASVARTCSFDSLLYLSSTRVYDRHPGPLAREDDELVSTPRDLFALSKAMGEAVALASGGRVARLSNVHGPRMEPHAFLADVLSGATGAGRVALESTLDSSRDFVSVADAVGLLVRIALGGAEQIYNVASGTPVTNGELTDALARLTGCEVVVLPNAARVVRPAIDIGRARAEFGFEPARLLDELPGLLATVAS